jgi:hypothetical protein
VLDRATLDVLVSAMPSHPDANAISFVIADDALA